MTGITGRARNGLIAFVATLLVAACGGGGSSIADGGIRGTGKSVGPVSGFGSVIVNGVRYDTDQAQFIVDDDELAVQDDLSEGMLVIVDVSEGDDDRAERVRYSDDLRGPVTGTFDPLSNRLEVLGQTVRFDGATVFRGLAQANPPSGQAYVSVSGWYLDSGEFLASYVRFRSVFDAQTDDVKVSGKIDGFNGDDISFQIGSLRVVYNLADEIEMDDDRDNLIPQEDEGAFVEVEGFLDGTGALVADEIEEDDLDRRLGDIDGIGIRILGSITSGISRTPSGTFEINGITVRANPATELVGGSTNDLTQGTRVLIEGVGNTQSLVVAKRIEFREADAEVEASIQDVTPSVDNPDREGWLLVGGVRVQVTLQTILVDDDEDDDSRKLNFGGLRDGDFVEVTGIPSADENGAYLEAVKLERDDDEEDDFELKGRVTAVDGPAASFTVLGVTMTTDGGTSYDDGLVDFDSIKTDQRLEIDYDIVGGVLVAREIERDEDDADDLDDNEDDDNDIGDDDADDEGDDDEGDED